MIYNTIPILIVGMLAYMFWRMAVQMRGDRIMNQRKATRGKYGFSRMHRARFLLRKAFRPSNDEPCWQHDLRRILDGRNG